MMASGWPKVLLGEVILPVERPEVPIPGTMYRQVGVRLWGQGAYEREPIDGSQTRYKTLSRVEADDIIVNKIWARNGSVAVVPENLAGCYGSGEFPTFVPIREKLEPRWFHWFTKTKDLWEQCDAKSRGTSGKNRIRPERFLDIEIPLPPFDEQRRIVARVEELAALIEEARGLRAKAQEEARVVMAAALQNVFSSAALAGCKSGLLGDEDIAEIIMGQSPPSHTYNDSGEGLPFFQGTSDFGPLFPKARKWCDEPKKVAMKNDVLLAVRAPVGPTNVCREECCIGRGLVAIRPKLSLHHKFLLYFLRSIESDLVSQAKGSTFTAIKKSHLQGISIPLPSLSQQLEVIAYLDSLQAQVDELTALQDTTQAELDALLPSVLDKAFRGEL